MKRPPPVILPPGSPESPLRLTVVRDAWRLFLQAPLAWMAHALPSTIMLTLANWQGTIVLEAVVKSGEFTSESLSGLLLTFWINLGGIWLVFFTGSGISGGLRKQLAGEKISVADTLEFEGKGLAAMLVSAAMAGMILLGYLCCYVPGLAAEGYCMTANLRAVDRNEGFIAAFRGSFQRVRLQLIVAGVSVHVLLSILLITGCVPFFGYLVGVPLYNICRGLFYLRLSADESGSLV